MSDTDNFANGYLRLEISHPGHSQGAYGRVGKRVVDILLALALLPLLTPLILILFAVTRMSGGPGFFAHSRIGRHGQAFRCFKISTMVADADLFLTNHLAAHPAAAREWRRNCKLTNDPRVTRFGRFLRRTGLDELPQIWNVLRGDMSFVGPRPVTEPELARYGQRKVAYLSLRPGVTGMWQIHGRTNGCYQARVSLDQDYLNKVSFKCDLLLIAQTVVSVMKMTGR